MHRWLCRLRSSAAGFLSTLLLAWAGCGGRPITPLTGELAKLEPDCAEAGARVCQAKCDAGDVESCLVIAYAYAYGITVSTNEKRAHELLGRACELGSGLACKGYGDGFRPQSLEARLAYERGCSLDHAGSCLFLGAVAYERAMRAGEDPQPALNSFAKGCELGEGRACGALGDVARLGLHGPPDLDGAVEYYQDACRLKNELACNTLENGDRVWLSLPWESVFEGVDVPDPPFPPEVLERASLRAESVAVTRVAACVIDDQHVESEMMTPSGNAAVDEHVREVVDQWRIRRRGDAKEFEETVCIPLRFVVRADGGPVDPDMELPYDPRGQ
jgi:hypothetical protein